MEKMLRTYCVSPAGRYFGMPLLLWRLVQGLQRSLATRRRASEPSRSEREVQIEEVIPEWRAVRGLGNGAAPNCQDFGRARPVQRKFGLEYLGVRVSLHTLADGERRVVHPCPTTHGELGAGCSASARAEFRRLMREPVRAWCLRTISFACYCRSVARSQ